MSAPVMVICPLCGARMRQALTTLHRTVSHGTGSPIVEVRR